MNASEMELLLTALRICALSQGGDVCDRCGDVIWPEFELVRCDFCWGKYGAPEESRIREANVKHRARIAAYEREMAESYYEENP
jgi:hypothetical protein